MSLIGGTAVDLGDMAVTAGVATVGSMAGTSITTELLGGATAIFGLAITPTLLTAGVGVVIGIGAAMAVSKFIDVTSLPMKGKRHPNGYVERRGKAGRLGRSLSERHQDYPNYHNEFGHLEADTIQGKNHRGAVMTLVERKSKAVIILNTRHKTDKAIFEKLDALLSVTPKGLFKSITFDNGKEFSKWKDIANKHDISTYFADVGAPNQRALNEHTNGLLRKDGLGKDMYLSDLPTDYVQQVASYRNNIPRKSLNYKTPLEVFIKYITNEQIVFF